MVLKKNIKIKSVKAKKCNRGKKMMKGGEKSISFNKSRNMIEYKTTKKMNTQQDLKDSLISKKKMIVKTLTPAKYYANVKTFNNVMSNKTCVNLADIIRSYKTILLSNKVEYDNVSKSVKIHSSSLTPKQFIKKMCTCLDCDAIEKKSLYLCPVDNNTLVIIDQKNSKYSV